MPKTSFILKARSIHQPRGCAKTVQREPDAGGPAVRQLRRVQEEPPPPLQRAPHGSQPVQGHHPPHQNTTQVVHQVNTHTVKRERYIADMTKQIERERKR